jgi:serine/threonine protein kinase
MIATWKQHEGQAVDGIALLQVLGGGQSSAVFLAERAGERCAVKLVPMEDAATQLSLYRWEQASKLSHPHLTRILQWGGGRLNGVSLVYVAMEFAEEELSSVDRPLTPKEARETLTPAVEALAYLHGRGFAHGRIKPSNILSVGEELKISGDAPLRKGKRHTSASAATPYDPPELAKSGVTPAGDVWSLGVTLVQAMTMELPAFEGGVLRLPDALRPDVFREVAAGCLERDPDRRWTMADLALWLERGTLPAPKRVRPRYLLPITAVAGVAVLGAVVWTQASPYLTSSKPASPPVEQLATPAPAPPQPPVLAEAATEPPRVAAKQPAKVASKETAKVAAKEPPKASASPPRETKSADVIQPVEPKPEPPPADAAPVVAASNVTSPDVLQPVVPDVLAKAVGTIHGKVPIVVRVQADAGGAVTSAAIESGGSSKYFANLALNAARQWKFVPGADAREWMLRFEFTRDTKHPVSAQVILAR